MKQTLIILTALAALLSYLAPVHADSLPTARFACSFGYDEMYAKLKAEPLLANLDKEQFGSPIFLRVTHSIIPTTAGAASGLASAVWAGGTLGLLPVVENKDLVINYDLYVNDTLLASYNYRRNMTSAKNIYTKDTTQGLGSDGMAWALATVPQFVSDATKNSKITDLIAEHQFYFGQSKSPR